MIWSRFSQQITAVVVIIDAVHTVTDIFVTDVKSCCQLSVSSHINQVRGSR